jgi:hypothetical protein
MPFETTVAAKAPATVETPLLGIAVPQGTSLPARSAISIAPPAAPSADFTPRGISPGSGMKRRCCIPRDRSAASSWWASEESMASTPPTSGGPLPS